MFGFTEPRTGVPQDHGTAVPLPGEWNRSDFLGTCVSFGLNARQISELSLSTPRPMKTVQHVYETIESQNLSRLYRSRKIENRRKGDHNQNIIRVFMRLYGQALELGHEVTEVARDQIPEEGERFRPDLAMRIGGRQFYVEIQLSKIQQTRWHLKMRNYLRFYRRIGRPFRVLKLVDRSTDIPKLREYARQVLSRNPSLNLYYFMTFGEFYQLGDVVSDEVWLGAWHPKQKYALM